MVKTPRVASLSAFQQVEGQMDASGPGGRERPGKRSGVRSRAPGRSLAVKTVTDASQSSFLLQGAHQGGERLSARPSSHLHTPPASLSPVQLPLCTMAATQACEGKGTPHSQTFGHPGERRDLCSSLRAPQEGWQLRLPAPGAGTSGRKSRPELDSQGPRQQTVVLLKAICLACFDAFPACLCLNILVYLHRY